MVVTVNKLYGMSPSYSTSMCNPYESTGIRSTLYPKQYDPNLLTRGTVVGALGRVGAFGPGADVAVVVFAVVTQELGGAGLLPPPLAEFV